MQTRHIAPAQMALPGIVTNKGTVTCKVANSNRVRGIHVVIVDVQLEVFHGIVPELRIVGH